MMHTITIHRHVGEDGKVEIELPHELHNTDVDMVVVMTRVQMPNPQTDASGWPQGYFERTFGALKDVEFERPAQGDYEIREEI